MKKNEYKINLSPEAPQDIQDAIEWYENQQKGLGKRFFSSYKNPN